MLSYKLLQHHKRVNSLKFKLTVLSTRFQSNIHRNSESLLIPTQLEMLTKLRSDISHEINYDVVIIGGKRLLYF